MKNKSQRHKEDNTFKFQPFSERINNIDVDIFHRVAHEYETQEEDQCYLYQSIEKWNVLNLTDGYAEFKKELKYNDLVTLPQLIVRKQQVVDILLKHLKLKNPLCLQPLLELTIAFAQDLRKEFYPYFGDFLQVLIELLSTKDTERLEWTFHCLAYLFKYLWRSLVKDIEIVFTSVLPLLSEYKPQYINNFAAESFAFLARKVKDRSAFLNLILKAVKNRKDGIQGCGKLLFEAMHGVDGSFHNSAETMLPFLIESVFSDAYPQQVLFEILEKVIACIVLHIHPQKSDLLWKTLLDSLTKLLRSWNDSKDEKHSKNIELVLKLLGQSIEHCEGKLLKNPASVVSKVVDLLNQSDLPESCLIMITQISILLLLSKNIKLSQEQASNITRKNLLLQNESVLLYFVDNVSKFSSFDALILPSFLRHCAKNSLNKKSFSVLTNLILKKSPLRASGIKLNEWSRYPLDFGTKECNNKMEVILLDFLKIEAMDETIKNAGTYLSSVICLPHLKLQNQGKCVELLSKNVVKITAFIDQLKSDEQMVNELLFLLNITVESLIRCSDYSALIEHFESIMSSLLRFCKDIKFLSALKILDMIITALRDDNSIITMRTLEKLEEALSNNFTSPYHEIRLLTSHIYSAFDDLPEFDIQYSTDPDITLEKWKVFTIFYTVESTEPSVHTYRDQLRQLGYFNFDKPQMLMCRETKFKCLPLKYLCGSLYMNFRLLWDPVLDIIGSIAHGLKIGEFWDVYAEQLEKANDAVKDNFTFEPSQLESDHDYLNTLYLDLQKLRDKPDFYNYRLLLWKAMDQFPDVAQVKTRTVSELFLNFIENEYMKTNSTVALIWSIKENNANMETSEDVDTVENGIDDEIKPKLTKPVPTMNANVKVKTLLQCMSVFSKLQNPQAMYREPELYKLYFDMLSHKNAEVQKAALNCLLTYKHKYLLPYKENLYNLISEKNFKSELTIFRVDQESSVVLPEHRPDLMRVIMRIVYSKMSVKTGLRTGGKSSGQLRRNLVIRFLQGCTEPEILEFVSMAFKIYDHYFQDNFQTMAETISVNVDLENIIPPKRLQSTVNLLSVIFEQLGSLMGNNVLEYLLKVLVVIGAILKGIYTQTSSIHSGYLATLRQLRTSSIKLVGRFFERFDRFPWTSDQIDSVFNVFVWPYVGKLNIEGIYSPTTLLKLFIQWGSNPRYFSLLVKYEDDNENEYVLPHIIKLLINEKSHGSVVNAIESMVEKILTLEVDAEEKELEINVNNLLPIRQDILDRIKLDDRLNYGSCILLPQVPVILEKIKKKLSSKTQSLNKKELFILSRLSELVWESDISNTILSMLLPIFLKKCKGNIEEDTSLQFLTTVKNLINNVDEPQQHLKNISPLFAEVEYVSSRKVLNDILNKAAAKSADTSLKKVACIITELNAFDARWVDQPDFTRRHEAFKEIKKCFEDNETLDIKFGILVIYNCYYLIKSQKDLSLRENSIFTLKTVCPLLVNKYKTSHNDLDYIFNRTLFTLIRNGMKSRNDDLRYECISLLGHMARECADSHFILRDLNILTSKIDLEIDFFENLLHLQIHRHGRALLRFCQITKELTTAFNVRTLTQFILPLASFYLCSEKYAGKNSVIDAAIETIGVVSRVLPWHQYEGLLKYYLNKLQRKVTFQKQLVRLIVAILNSFHFDLQKGIVTNVDIKSGLDEDLENVHETKDKDNDNEAQVTRQESNEQASEEAQKGDEDKSSDEDDESGIDEVESESQGDDEAEDDIESHEEDVKKEVKVYEKVTLLCKSTATRVIQTIQIVLLPQLHKTLAQRTQHDESHKVNRKKIAVEQEEEDLLRVPISLAVVKLLQQLPKEILDLNLPGIFMKLCTFLRSHLESVRRVARETLQNIMLTLGPEYLKVLLAEIPPLLTRGYQAHVLVFTVHGVLNCLKDMYQPTHIDNVLLTVLDLCKADLFGVLSEEKEVDKIRVKVQEAKSTKSFYTLNILAQYITNKCLMDLILPLKDVLHSTHSFKIVSKAQDALRHVALGLVDNTFIETQSLIKFAYGTASECIPELVPEEKPVLTETDRQKLERQKPDCFILPKTPERPGVRMSVTQSPKTNAHVLVEFGLRLCFMLLKRDKLKDDDFRPFIDPFVPVFKKCLTSKHIKLCTLTLNCLTWVLKYDLPSLRKNIEEITNIIFNILHKYASAGLSKGDNFDLVVAAFKAMSVLVRDAKYHTIKTKQLKVLLLYVEQDMHDYDRQAIAFNLLKAIISRKLNVSEIHDIMEKVAELSIVSEQSHVRSQARSVFLHFFMEYPLGAKLEKHLAFYIGQTAYEMQHGRESAIEMIQMLVHSLPQQVLKEHSGTLLVTLGARLVNDEVPECRKMVAQCINSMLGRLTKVERDPLFDIILVWLKDKNTSHRRLAAQLCGIVVAVEKSNFETRLPTLLPLILLQFGINNAPGRLVRIRNEEDQKKENNKSEEYQRLKDHHLYQVLQMLLKISAYCPSFIKNTTEIQSLAGHIQTLLAYPHEWVRLAAAQFLGFVLSTMDIDRLSDLLVSDKSEENGYLYSNPLSQLKTLTLDLCDQLQPGNIKNDLAEQVIKNLVFVARVLQKVPIKRDTKDNNKPNLLWLTKRMRKIVNTEVVEVSSSTVLRMEVFKWIAAVITAVELEYIKPISHHLLAPLVREMITTEESNAPLRQLAKEVGGLFKKKFGVEYYTEVMSRLEQNLSVKRAERKRSRHQLAVIDPEAFAKKKIKRHEKKKEAKKRKISEMKGKPKMFKKRKIVDLEDNSEIM